VAASGLLIFAGDIVHAVFKALKDHFDEYKSAHPLMKTWDPKTSVDTLVPAPVHPAALEYCRKKGLWTPDIHTRNEELAKLIGKAKRNQSSWRRRQICHITLI